LCLAAIVYLVLGLILTVFYLLLPLPEGTQRQLEAKDKDAKDELTPESKHRLELEYETFNLELARRGEQFIISGSIFVTLSFLILAEACMLTACRRIVLAYASLILYGLWLLVYGYTTTRLDRLSYIRIRSIEELLGIQVHRYVFCQAPRQALWMRFRRRFWAIILMLLSVAGSLVLLF